MKIEDAKDRVIEVDLENPATPEMAEGVANRLRAEMGRRKDRRMARITAAILVIGLGLLIGVLVYQPAGDEADGGGDSSFAGENGEEGEEGEDSNEPPAYWELGDLPVMVSNHAINLETGKETWRLDEKYEKERWEPTEFQSLYERQKTRDGGSNNTARELVNVLESKFISREVRPIGSPTLWRRDYHSKSYVCTDKDRKLKPIPMGDLDPKDPQNHVDFCLETGSVHIIGLRSGLRLVCDQIRGDENPWYVVKWEQDKEGKAFLNQGEAKGARNPNSKFAFRASRYVYLLSVEARHIEGSSYKTGNSHCFLLLEQFNRKNMHPRGSVGFGKGLTIREVIARNRASGEIRDSRREALPSLWAFRHDHGKGFIRIGLGSEGVLFFRGLSPDHKNPSVYNECSEFAHCEKVLASNGDTYVAIERESKRKDDGRSQRRRPATDIELSRRDSKGKEIWKVTLEGEKKGELFATAHGLMRIDPFGASFYRRKDGKRVWSWHQPKTRSALTFGDNVEKSVIGLDNGKVLIAYYFAGGASPVRFMLCDLASGETKHFESKKEPVVHSEYHQHNYVVARKGHFALVSQHPNTWYIEVRKSSDGSLVKRWTDKTFTPLKEDAESDHEKGNKEEDSKTDKQED